MKEEKEENENLYKNKKILNEKQIDSKCLTYLSKKKKTNFRVVCYELN